MYFALVYYPGIKNADFKYLRHKYEPFSNLLPEHITFIFPVPESIGIDQITSHINKTLLFWNAFEIHFCGLKKCDNWLFLVVKEGNDSIIKLHDDLYTDILKPHYREDLPYKPHVALGYFGKGKYDFSFPEKETPFDKEKFIVAKNEFKNLNLDFWRKIDELTLLRINDDFSKCWKIARFKMGKDF